MKSFFSSLLALLAGACMMMATPARAQDVPNGGFETWTTRNGVEIPVNWLTTDDFLGGVFATGTVTKTAVARSGSFAVQLQTLNVLGLNQFPGILILGTSLRGGATIAAGVPFTARPRNLQFYYQLSGPQALTDSAGMVVFLTRRVNGSPTIVAGAEFAFPALATSYTLANLPLQYVSGLAPDSLSMVFFSGITTQVNIGSVLRVDDISFTGTATAVRDPALNAALGVAPNPSPDGRYLLSAPTEPALLSASLVVLDATGRIVRREGAAPRPTATRALDLGGLPPGIYTLQLFTPRGLVTRKLSR